MDEKKRVILVTDGDESAKQAVQLVAQQIGGRCISQSWGNPSRLTGEELVTLIKKTPYDPVLVMFDDSGYHEEGRGEHAMRVVATHPEFTILGAIAVASTTHFSEWTKVDVSVDRYGNLTEYGVDKYGLQDLEVGRIDGDTVYSLDQLHIPVIVGVGDIGKMAGQDTVEKGAPITRKAVEIILERSGYYD
ncbi:stage V sporulation protein AE [Desertibacillus haloalkaliphilus]|uniref:stage V sporulation protein AE n=1 Tax=Desertibacillus haloalkaliphilus TaxID=1328930 RepID=UPI001C254413|nr:stage V sporulation protein AE [Desertibacillus haloalkaliphilus]MBU8907872.1 stage V sporulation protein AE [Desertibacillus haloalkaliphilus]